MKNNYCTIYAITNTNNKKVYIGQTWENLDRRFTKHKTGGCLKLTRAMGKYGVGTFSIENIAMASSQDNANYLEIHFIEYFNSIENGYNIKEGGSNGRLSEESKKKISVANTGKIRTQKTKDQISASCIGKTVSSETRAKISNSSLGKPKSVEARNKMSVSQKGKKMSKETIQKIASAKNGAKIDMIIALQIRNDYATGQFNYAQLGEKYCIDKTTVGLIVRGKTWKS